VGELLQDETLTLAEIGRRTGLSRERVRQIQRNYFAATALRPHGGQLNRAVPARYSNTRFRREVARILAAVGARYCTVCRGVKDLCEFPAWSTRGHCRACLARRQRRYSAAHPEYVRHQVEKNRERRAARAKEDYASQPG
jgi:hypothetical protein